MPTDLLPQIFRSLPYEVAIQVLYYVDLQTLAICGASVELLVNVFGTNKPLKFFELAHIAVVHETVFKYLLLMDSETALYPLHDIIKFDRLDLLKLSRLDPSILSIANYVKCSPRILNYIAPLYKSKYPIDEASKLDHYHNLKIMCGEPQKYSATSAALTRACKNANFEAFKSIHLAFPGLITKTGLKEAVKKGAFQLVKYMVIDCGYSWNHRHVEISKIGGFMDIFNLFRQLEVEKL